jgi:hypothetical protein
MLLFTKKSGYIALIASISLIYLFFSPVAMGQVNRSSPVSWLFPEGNLQGTRYIPLRSSPQNVSAFAVKWSSTDIKGDVQPLIGNLINNDKILPQYTYAPNEIAAVIGSRIIIIDAIGKTHRITTALPYLKGISMLFDTTGVTYNSGITNPLLMGLETYEFPANTDSLAIAYIGGYDVSADSAAILKRLALDLRPFKPNNFASIRPVFGEKYNNEILIYSTINMSSPVATDPFPVDPPYFRGLAQFNTGVEFVNYPLPDVGDDQQFRVTVGPQIGFAQPSINMMPDSSFGLLLPSYPSPCLTTTINSPVLTFGTDSYSPYLIGLNIANAAITEGLPTVDLTSTTGTGNRPQVRSYYVNITDANNPSDSLFILVSEEYKGRNDDHCGLSEGKSKLHLFRTDGTPVTFPGDFVSPSFEGGNDHLWSVAIGNVDGNSSNQWLPYYPNNPGKEIIVTQTSKEFAYPESKIFILKYNSGSSLAKPTPPNSYLFPLDTICSQKMSGWVAAVNDLDGAPDGKDEIVIADGSKLRILRLRDYSDFAFRAGMPFDTVLTCDFQEIITGVAVADLEGDKQNDLIVTTFGGIYALGTLSSNAIAVLQPKNSELLPPVDYCAGDSIIIKWQNILPGQNLVNIIFKPYTNNQPSDTTFTLFSNLDNTKDIDSVLFVVDSAHLGFEGRFIVESSRSPGIVSDFSSLVRFNLPKVIVNPPANRDYFVDEVVTMTGSAQCLDSVSIEYSFDSTSWVNTSTVPVNKIFDYSIDIKIPCAPFFQCFVLNSSSSIFVRLIGSNKGTLHDTTGKIALSLKPEKFPFKMDTMPTIRSSKEFKWDYLALKNLCDTVEVAISFDDWQTYTIVGKVPVSAGIFVWNVPLEAPNIVSVGLCCGSGCVMDTAIFSNYKPTYINIVAPNPFKPPVETAEICYTVQKNANVTIRIYDQDNRLVKELVNNEAVIPSNAYCTHWDGTVWDGSLAPNGMYYLIMELSTGEHEMHPIFVRK